MKSLCLCIILALYSTNGFSKTCYGDKLNEASDAVKLVTITFSLFTLFMGTACQTIELKQDPNESSIDAEFNTVETICGTNRNVGNNACLVTKGDSKSDLKFQIRTIQAGTVSVYSDVCKVDWSRKYSKSGWVNVPLKGVFEKSCLFSIVVNPEYEDQELSTHKVHGFKGEVLVKVLDKGKPTMLHGPKKSWAGVIPLQIRQNPHNVIEDQTLVRVDVQGSKEGVYRITGCGDTETGKYTSDFNFNPNKSTKTCILHGAVVPFDKPNDLLFSLMVNVFQKDYNRLAEPSMIVERKNINLDFGKEVTFVELDDKSYNDNRVTIKRYNPKKHYEVRAYTVKGRYILGLHDDGNWKWYR